jgi:hypothetical protein
LVDTLFARKILLGHGKTSINHDNIRYLSEKAKKKFSLTFQEFDYSLDRFILPAIEQIRSDPVTPTRLRDVPALEAFRHDLPLLFGASVYSWFPAHVASWLEALILPN